MEVSSPLERQVRQFGLTVHEDPQIDVHQLLQNLGVKGRPGREEEGKKEGLVRFGSLTAT